MASNTVKVDAKAVRELIRSQNTTINKVSEVSGVSEKTVHRFLTNGIAVKFTTLEKFLGPLNVDATEYIAEQGNHNDISGANFGEIEVDFGGRAAHNGKRVTLTRFQHPSVDQLPATLLYEFDFSPENTEVMTLLDKIGPLFEGAFAKSTVKGGFSTFQSLDEEMSFSKQYNKLTYKGQIDPLIRDFESHGINVFYGHWQRWKVSQSEQPVYDNGEGGPNSILYERYWKSERVRGFFFTSQTKFSRAVANVDKGSILPEFMEDGFIDLIDGRELKITAEQHYREGSALQDKYEDDRMDALMAEHEADGQDEQDDYDFMDDE